jgi:signal transduction histidine kinase
MVKLAQIRFYLFALIGALGFNVACGQNIKSQSDAIFDTVTVSGLQAAAAANIHRYPNSSIYFSQKALAATVVHANESAKYEAMLFVGSMFNATSRYDSALPYFAQAISGFKSLKLQHLADSVSLIAANNYYLLSKFDTAHEISERALLSAKHAGDNRTVMQAYTLLGNEHFDFDRQNEALGDYLSALSVAESLKDTGKIYSTFSNIALVYSAIGDFAKAMEYIDKVLTGNVALISEKDLMLAVENKGIIFGQADKFDSAVVYLRRALDIAMELGDENEKLGCMNNLAQAYIYNGRNTEALSIYKMVLERSTLTDNANVIAPALAGYGNVLLSMNQLKECIPFLDTAYLLAKKYKLRDVTVNVAQNLSLAYEKLGAYAKSLEYYKIATRTQDSLNNERNQKKLVQLQYQYNLVKKEEQIKILLHSQKEKSLQNKKLFLLSCSLIFICGVLIVVCIMLYRVFVAKSIHAKTIEQQQKEIEQQTQDLKNLNQYKDKIFSIVAHDLRGPLASLTSALEMVDLDLIDLDGFKLLKPMLDEELRMVNSLMENLLHWSAMNFKGKTAVIPSKIDLVHVVGNMISIFHIQTQRKNIHIHHDTTIRYMVVCDSNHLDIILRNLISNAIKFTEPNGMIKIEYEEVNEYIKFSISDNGIGIPAEKVSHLFDDRQQSSYGTSGEKGTGLGLFLIYEFIKLNNGEIDVVSTPGKGTTFHVYIKNAAPSGEPQKTNRIAI